MKIKSANFFMNFGLSCVLLSYLLVGCGAPLILEGPAGAEGPRGPNGVGIVAGPTLSDVTCVSGGGLLSGNITNNNSAPALCRLVCGAATTLILMTVSTLVNPSVSTPFDEFINNTPLGAATYFCFAECVSTGEYASTTLFVNCT